MFGKVTCEMLKGLLHQTVESMSEELFNNALSMAGDLLASAPLCSGKVESDLAVFAGLHETYSTYYIQKLPGNRGRLGNSAAKANHSSVLCFLNGGHTKTNTYQETPIRVVRDMMSRQFNSVIITNKRLYKMQQDMAVECAVLQQQPQTKEVLDLRQAPARIHLPSYKSYECSRTRTPQYSRPVSSSPSESGQLLKIQSITHPDAPLRFIFLPCGQCNCFWRTAELLMCVHEIRAYGGFKERLFLDRHFERVTVTGSVTECPEVTHPVTGVYILTPAPSWMN